MAQKKIKNIFLKNIFKKNLVQYIFFTVNLKKITI